MRDRRWSEEIYEQDIDKLVFVRHNLDRLIADVPFEMRAKQEFQKSKAGEAGRSGVQFSPRWPLVVVLVAWLNEKRNQI